MRKRNEVPPLKLQKKADLVYTLLWSVVLCVYAAIILCANFTRNPENYCTDMYADMLFAMKVWEQKTLFPAGWIFGNQLYVVATPVLAAPFVGLTGDPRIAMGIASSLMAAGVLLSFYWMLMPVLPKVHQRLAALVAFLTVVLLSGDAAFTETGWQLLFTMCSYYACYAITLFLGLGCYLRKDRAWLPRHYILLALTCLMSLGTGIQSLRQTLIMVCPLVAIEVIRGLESLLRKEKFTLRPLYIAGSISAANLLGLVIRKFLPAEQITTTGSVTRLSLGSMVRRLGACFVNVFTIFGDLAPIAVGIVLLFLTGLVIAIIRKRSVTKDPAILCAALLVISVGGVLLINITTAMQVRGIYYFVMYIIVALAAVYFYARFGQLARIAAAAALAVCVTLGCAQKLVPFLQVPQDSPRIEAVADYLRAQGFTTFYANWNSGEEVAIAADFEIEAGFWKHPEQPFEKMPFLCDHTVFEADPSECAYLLRGKKAARQAETAARDMGTELVLLEYFPEANLYVYTAAINLMH